MHFFCGEAPRDEKTGYVLISYVLLVFVLVLPGDKKRIAFFLFFLFFRAHRTKRSDQKTRKGRAVWVRRTRKALSRKREMLGISKTLKTKSAQFFGRRISKKVSRIMWYAEYHTTMYVNHNSLIVLNEFLRTSARSTDIFDYSTHFSQ